MPIDLKRLVFADRYFNLQDNLSPSTIVYWLLHHLQAETSQHERSPLNPKGVNMVNGTSGSTIGSSEMLVEGEAVRVYSTDTSEKAVNMPSFVGIPTKTVNKDKSFENLSSISTAAEAQGYPIKSEQATVTLEHKKSLEDGPSILDKIFNTAINLNSGDSSNITQVSLFIQSVSISSFSPETAPMIALAFMLSLLICNLISIQMVDNYFWFSVHHPVVTEAFSYTCINPEDDR